MLGLALVIRVLGVLLTVMKIADTACYLEEVPGGPGPPLPPVAALHTSPSHLHLTLHLTSTTSEVAPRHTPPHTLTPKYVIQFALAHQF